MSVASKQHCDYLRAVSSSQNQVSGWGRIPVVGREITAADLTSASQSASLMRGLGRSYGDSSLPTDGGEVLSTRLADRMIAFEPISGLLRAEAGLSLLSINQLFLPHGYFSPVTPGTQFVTLGGMVASDVHGKEHHVRGCFGEHITRLWVRVANGDVVECSDSKHQDLFRGCIGGMGLLGHILEVEFAMMRIPSQWIVQRSERVSNIDAYIARLDVQKDMHPYTMGWIDCLRTGANMGRGILMAGRWAEPHECKARAPYLAPRVQVPFEFPEFVLGPTTVKAFNTAFYWKHFSKNKISTIGWEPFFYPLDAASDWNRMYGPRGFTQYQCVLPKQAGPNAPRRLLQLLSKHGGASFLCVIKDCGAEGKGTLSFPLHGTSIALDIAARDNTQALVDILNEQVIADAGRIYLSKDQFTRREHYHSMDEKRIEAFLQIKAKWDPKARFQSAQSIRLFGDLRA